MGMYLAFRAYRESQGDSGFPPYMCSFSKGQILYTQQQKKRENLLLFI